jgi:ParB family chromosome partitioning protein
LPQDESTWFAWLLEQPQETVLSLIVFATAACVDAVESRASGTPVSEPLAQALALDMADWWEATPESYLNLVPKAKLVDMVTDIAGAQAASDLAKMKKTQAVEFAAKHAANSRWLPLPLRPAVEADAVCAEQDK